MSTAETTPDSRAAALAGTRMLIAEQSFEALLDMLIEAGTVSRSQVAVMADNLSRDLLDYAGGKLSTEWQVVPSELLHVATRYSLLAESMRGGT